MMRKHKEKFSPRENALKYGNPGNDLFADWETIHALISLNGMLTMAHAYLVRYNSKSTKSGNQADLDKAADCLRRAKSMCEWWVELREMEELISIDANADQVRSYLLELRKFLPKFTPELPF